ncbi:MAG: serine/threonine protein kinase [Deltaproteobacteria bacterium]|nr:serine/threonine protein kinase [Deltaproteobacteria bacterium]
MTTSRAPTFGPFVLDQLLGVGGTAEVYVAHRSEAPEQRFVVKRIRPELATNEEFARRLELEAQVASKARHPNLIRFLEYGRVGDCRYIVLEHVRGYNLSRVLEHASKRPGVDVCLSIAKGLLGALSAMHAYVDDSGAHRPVLHRDVTPNNIVLTLEGRPVLIDLGIAKDVLGPAITQIGKVIGTSRYMSPEHKLNEFLDERTDVFSASAVIFEAIAGRPPWPKLAGAKELLRTVFDPPEIDDELAGRVSRSVLEVLEKGLACDRSMRYRNAAEMLRALEATPECQAREGQEEWRAIREWLDGAGVTPDDELDQPVVKSASAVAGSEPVRWTSDGHIASKSASSEKPAASHATVLDVPPLPPARHALTLTRDIRIPAELAPSRRWPVYAVVALVLIIVALAFLLR